MEKSGLKKNIMHIDELEQTLVLIKPDALKNSLTGYILSQFSEFHTGLCFAGTKIVQVHKMLAEEHYNEHRGKPFYSSLIEYICGKTHYPNEPPKQRVIAIVYQGINAIQTIRNIAGPTNPQLARMEKPGCIRSLGTTVPQQGENENMDGERIDNLIHASANSSDAEHEIKLWFRPSDIPPNMHEYPTQRCKRHVYYKKGKILSEYESDSICLMTPGEITWLSDMAAIEAIQNGEKTTCRLEAVVAKYLINEVV